MARPNALDLINEYESKNNNKGVSTSERPSVLSLIGEHERRQEEKKTKSKYDSLYTAVRNRYVDEYKKAVDNRRKGYNDYVVSLGESAEKFEKDRENNKDLYNMNSEYNLYYFGLEEVYVNVNNKNMTLENALKSGYLTLDGIIQKANKDMGEAMPANSDQNMVKKYPRADYCNDGGTIEYHYEDYTIIKLHRLDGNRDMYIGAPDLRVDDLGL